MILSSEPRAMVKVIDGYGNPECVICTQDEINETLRAALEAGCTVRAVEPFWSEVEEDEACRADQQAYAEVPF